MAKTVSRVWELRDKIVEQRRDLTELGRSPAKLTVVSTKKLTAISDGGSACSRPWACFDVWEKDLYNRCVTLLLLM